MFTAGLLLGLMIGGTVGAFAMALAAMGSRTEESTAPDARWSMLARADEILAAAQRGAARSGEILVGVGTASLDRRAGIDRRQY